MDRARTLLLLGCFAAFSGLGVGLSYVMRQPAGSGSEIAAPYRVRGAGPVAAPAAVRWFDTEWGWIGVARDTDAAIVAEDVRAAVAAFYRYFGKRPEPGAVLDLDFAALGPDLKSAGTAWLLPWPFRASGAPGGDVHHGDARSALRHEIGHALFLLLMVPNTRGNQYGGDAPDWLDEAAAMMAETAQATRLRRVQFAEAFAAGRVPAFTQLITGEHPLFGNVRVELAVAAAQSGPGAPAVLRLDAAETGVDPAVVGDFYASARAIADYLIARSGDDRILARVSALVRGGGGSSAWLGVLCAQHVLPVELGLIDADFAAWAAAQRVD